MDYFNKRGQFSWKAVVLIAGLMSFVVALAILGGVSDEISENADFNCIVGNRLANMAGATSNPCRTTLATIEQIDFNDDLTINNLKCPQYSTSGFGDINSFANSCGTVKLADKGIICWRNYMSGKGDLKTASCYNLCMKPSYGSIEAKEGGIITRHDHIEGLIIPLEFKGLTGENLLIFEDDGFNAENRQHIGQLIELEKQITYEVLDEGEYGPVAQIITFVPPTTSKLSKLEIIKIEDTNGATIEAIHYKRANSGDVTIVIRIPFQDITVPDLKYVFENELTTMGIRQGEEYTDKIDKDLLRMNTISFYDQGFMSGAFVDTNLYRPDTSITEEFTIEEDESWLIQYIDSADWVPFVAGLSTWFNTDISDDSLNYAYNGVC